MRFEERKFCQVSTLMARWECSRDLIYNLASKKVLKVWHPEGTAGNKGLRVDVQSVLEVERDGYIEMES